MTPAVEFERELEIFRTEAETAIQCLYTYLAIHDTAGRNRKTRDMLDEFALFWNTNLGALQTAAFIVLGRIFDQNSVHNIDRLLKLGKDNLGIFSKLALASRRQGQAPVPPDYLREYLRSVYEPTAEDFRRLRGLVSQNRKIYETRYRDIRRKWFAHKEIAESAEIGALFANTNIRELQRLVTFLGSLYDALWQLFANGSKPALRQRRYSISSIRNRPASARRVQERITIETARYLRETGALLAAKWRLKQPARKRRRR